MEQYADLLETELEEAVQVKNRKALHRYSLLLAERMVAKSEYEKETGGIRSEIRLLVETIDHRFQEMNRRFDDMNSRFNDSNKKFTMLFSFITVGFTVLTLAIVLVR